MYKFIKALFILFLIFFCAKGVSQGYHPFTQLYQFSWEDIIYSFYPFNYLEDNERLAFLIKEKRIKSVTYEETRKDLYRNVEYKEKRYWEFNEEGFLKASYDSSSSKEYYVQYEYNKKRELTKIIGTDSFIINFKYKDKNVIQKLVLNNGDTSSCYRFSYDKKGQLKTMLKGCDSIIDKWEYFYDREKITCNYNGEFDYEITLDKAGIPVMNKRKNDTSVYSHSNGMIIHSGLGNSNEYSFVFYYYSGGKLRDYFYSRDQEYRNKFYSTLHFEYENGLPKSRHKNEFTLHDYEYKIEGVYMYTYYDY